MAGVEHDDKGLGKPPAKASGEVNADLMTGLVDAIQTGFLERRKSFRNQMDQEVPKILSRSPRQLGALAAVVQMNGGSCGPKSPDKLGRSLCALSGVLLMDTSNIPPKQYEALVKQVWKTAKANIDETLETPEAKQLLAPKGLPKK
jgi:hypothetical protein